VYPKKLTKQLNKLKKLKQLQLRVGADVPLMRGIDRTHKKILI